MLNLSVYSYIIVFLLTRFGVTVDWFVCYSWQTSTPDEWAQILYQVQHWIQQPHPYWRSVSFYNRGQCHYHQRPPSGSTLLYLSDIPTEINGIVPSRDQWYSFQRTVPFLIEVSVIPIGGKTIIVRCIVILAYWRSVPFLSGECHSYQVSVILTCQCHSYLVSVSLIRSLSFLSGQCHSYQVSIILVRPVSFLSGQCHSYHISVILIRSVSFLSDQCHPIRDKYLSYRRSLSFTGVILVAIFLRSRSCLLFLCFIS
jgi:hypothetical protein